MPGTLKLKSEAGGSVILAANTTAASDLTVSVPPFAGTMATLVSNATGPTFSVPNVAGNGPAFSAYSIATQNPASATVTKVIFGATLFDTNSNFNTTTGRFTPTVAGYYQFNASVSMAADSSMSAGQLYFYKNGSGGNWPSYENTSQTGTGYQGTNCSALIYCNGTTDYVEVYGQITGSGTLRYFFSSSTNHTTTFQGYLARSA